MNASVSALFGRAFPAILRLGSFGDAPTPDISTFFQKLTFNHYAANYTSELKTGSRDEDRP